MNYEEVVNAAKAYADRNDIEVSNSVDTFILMAEARMNRVLKTREQSARIYTPTVTDQEYYGLPSDFRGMRDIQLNTESSEGSLKAPMNYLSPMSFNIEQNRPYNGSLYYTIIANQFQIHPKQDVGNSIEIVYYQKVPNLNNLNIENWMSIDSPDIYLAGIVAEIEKFVKNYEVASAWDASMTRSISELKESDSAERWSGAPLTIRLEV